MQMTIFELMILDERLTLRIPNANLVDKLFLWTREIYFSFLFAYNGI